MSVLNNTSLIAAFSATAIAQVLKWIIVLISEKRFAWDRMVETGGMPSSHSAGMCALATSVGLISGVTSQEFAIAVVLASVVMYDATGVRRAAGLHAEYLNTIINELSHIFKRDGEEHHALKTLLGHTYTQVLAGAILGIGIGFLFYYMM